MKFAAGLILFLCGGAAGYGLRGWASAPPPPPAGITDMSIAEGGVYHVRNVIDGDTLILENNLRVRYHGVNAPEMGHYVKDPDPLGPEATARNIALLKNKRVRVHLTDSHFDQYGRVVARIFAVPEEEHSTEPETDVAATLLREGLARVMGLGLTSDELREFKAIEAQARESKAGIWGLPGQAQTGTDKPYCSAAGRGIYHLRICAAAKKITAAKLHVYAAAEEAEAAGLKPCSHCLGKQPDSVNTAR